MLAKWGEDERRSQTLAVVLASQHGVYTVWVSAKRTAPTKHQDPPPLAKKRRTKKDIDQLLSWMGKELYHVEDFFPKEAPEMWGTAKM